MFTQERSSNTDKHITQRLQEVMALIYVRELDHFVVGNLVCLSLKRH
ncbi:JAB domain-containing protein [Photobacterium damselae]